MALRNAPSFLYFRPHGGGIGVFPLQHKVGGLQQYVALTVEQICRPWGTEAPEGACEPAVHVAHAARPPFKRQKGKPVHTAIAESPPCVWTNKDNMRLRAWQGSPSEGGFTLSVHQLLGPIVGTTLGSFPAGGPLGADRSEAPPLTTPKPRARRAAWAAPICYAPLLKLTSSQGAGWQWPHLPGAEFFVFSESSWSYPPLSPHLLQSGSKESAVCVCVTLHAHI